LKNALLLLFFLPVFVAAKTAVKKSTCEKKTTPSLEVQHQQQMKLIEASKPFPYFTPTFTVLVDKMDKVIEVEGRTHYSQQVLKPVKQELEDAISKGVTYRRGILLLMKYANAVNFTSAVFRQAEKYKSAASYSLLLESIGEKENRIQSFKNETKLNLDRTGIIYERAITNGFIYSPTMEEDDALDLCEKWIEGFSPLWLTTRIEKVDGDFLSPKEVPFHDIRHVNGGGKVRSPQFRAVARKLVEKARELPESEYRDKLTTTLLRFLQGNVATAWSQMVEPHDPEIAALINRLVELYEK